MSKKNSQRPPTARVWPYTPEPSPPLKSSALVREAQITNMASDEATRARPISMSTRREGVMSPGRPTLDDVLSGTAPPPYTLAAYEEFLTQQHCPETLEFVTESRKYSENYQQALKELKAESITTGSDQGLDLMQDWGRILDVYVKPGAPREINIPAEERDDLIHFPCEPTLPPPEALNPCVKRMYDLMSDSIFIPFCNSLKAPSHAQTYNAVSDLSSRMEMGQARTFDERREMHRREPSKSHPQKSSSATSGSAFEHSRTSVGHRPTQSSSLSSALGKQSANRLSTLVSNSSARSEAVISDTSGGGVGDTPPPGDVETVMTPPTTPPRSDLGTPSSASLHAPTSNPNPNPNPLRQQRSESGGWSRKMGKLFSGGSTGNKKRGSFLE